MPSRWGRGCFQVRKPDRVSRFLHVKDILDSIEPFLTLNILEIFASGLYAIGNRFPLEIGVNNNLKKNV